MNNKIVNMNGEPKKRRSIDWTNPEDVRAVVIASLGFSNHCVREYCNLTDGQIGYRMKLAHQAKARKEFRDGTSALAKRVIHQNADYAEGRIEKQLAKQHQTDTKKAAAA